MTKSTASDKNATITKSTAKVATVTKSADYVRVATNGTSKVDHSKKTSELAAKDVKEIVSITPISKPTKIELKEVVSLKPASTAPKKIGTLKVFSKQTIPPIEEEEHKKPQEVGQNRQEKLATEVTNKFVDEEEDFKCKDCLALFWFKSELCNHLREAHGVKDPELVEQKKLKVKIFKAKIENLENKLNTPASEGGTNTASIKIPPFPKKGSLLSSTEEPKNKMAEHNTANKEVKDDDDDTADYSCKIILKRKHFFSLNDSPAKKIYSNVNDVDGEDKSPKFVTFSNNSQHVTNGGNWIDSVKCRNDDLYRKGGPILKEGWKICFEEQKLDGRNVLVARYMLPNGKVYTRGSNGYGIPELMTELYTVNEKVE